MYQDQALMLMSLWISTFSKNLQAIAFLQVYIGINNHLLFDYLDALFLSIGFYKVDKISSIGKGRHVERSAVAALHGIGLPAQ